MSLKELRSSAGESTETVARRVAAARALQLDRFGLGTPTRARFLRRQYWAARSRGEIEIIDREGVAQ